MPALNLRPGSACVRLTLLTLPVMFFAAGCKKPEIKTYVAPKDQEEVRPANSELADGLPKISWTTPAGWKELGPDKMSAVRFSAPGDTNIMVTPLPLMAGNEGSLVNMWRQMLTQPLLSEEDSIKALSEVTIGGDSGRMFEIAGAQPESGEMKIITAFVHRDSRSWFFKLQGTPAAVEAQRAAYIEFLKTVKFDIAQPPSPAPPPPSAPAASSEVPGTPPADWTVQTPGAMQAAKFTVPDKDGAKADVFVSIFPSDTGGNVANVRRWRGQLELPDADDAAIAALIKPLPGGPEGAIMTDLANEGKGRALIGAIVPRGGRYYFYKLFGGTAAVAAAREAFINYCKAGP